MLDPNLAEAWVNQGTALIGLKRYSEALSASERALAQNPGPEAAHQNRETALQSLSPVTTQIPSSITTALMALASGTGLFLLRKI